MPGRPASPSCSSDTGTGAVQGGTPLALTMYVFDAAGDCAPVQGAQVDIWHANAQGRYSDVAQNQTTGLNWLRGYQVTDAEGKVTFQTIWPGWYDGRAVHIHFKVRKDGLEFTSQLFFTDAMNSTVFANAPYKTRGNPDVTDSSDNIYGTDGASLLLDPIASGGGYSADFSVGISGGSSGTATTPSDTTVGASLTSVKAFRTSSGARRVRGQLSPEETVVLRATVTRAGRTLARRTVDLTAGDHTVRVPIGGAVRAGGARVTLTLTDAAQNTRTYHRSVHIPTRRT